MAQIQSYLCDTANTKKQHYGELYLTQEHTLTNTHQDLPFLCFLTLKGCQLVFSH